MRIEYEPSMLNVARSSAEGHDEPRRLAGHRSYGFGASPETIERLRPALEASEISVAKMTAMLQLPDEASRDKPKRRPIPDHIPRQEIELTTGDDDGAHCGGALRRSGEDVTEELDFAPGRFTVNCIVRPCMACSDCDAFTQARRHPVLSSAAVRGLVCWRRFWSANTGSSAGLSARSDLRARRAGPRSLADAIGRHVPAASR